jgi:EpsI family protein
MIARRELILGAACLAAAAGAAALKPRRHLSLMPTGVSLGELVPRSLAGWTSEDTSELVRPQVEGSLADRLYGATVSRIYRQAATGEQVMLLIAHGDTQTDTLQLHRPESCYPAVGFELSDIAPVDIALWNGVTIPGRRLTAHASGRREHILYWTRLGEFLPQSASEQGRDRLSAAMDGYVADGLLVRCSAVGRDPAPSFALTSAFIDALIAAVAPGRRRVLIGTRRAMKLV